MNNTKMVYKALQNAGYNLLHAHDGFISVRRAGHDYKEPDGNICIALYFNRIDVQVSNHRQGGLIEAWNIMKLIRDTIKAAKPALKLELAPVLMIPLA